MSNSFFSPSSGIANQNFYADYASIRNGSYSKLLKAYYGKGQSSASSSGSTKGKTTNILDKLLEEKKNPKVSKEVQEANSNLTTSLSNLNKSVTSLQSDKTYESSEDGKSATDKVVSAMKAFVADYNDVVTSAKRSTLSSQTSHVAEIMRNTSANADKLKEMGITINANGTLQLSEAALKGTDVSKVQEMFSSSDSMSYGSRILSRINFSTASSSTNTSNKTDSTTDKTETDTETKPDTGASSLKDVSKALASSELFEKIKDKDGNEVYDIDNIFATAKSFVKNYNLMLDKAGNSLNSGIVSNLTRIREKTAQNANALKEIGISVDVKGRLKIDEDTFKDADMSKVQKAFKDYGSSISTSASLVDFYLTTQANASNGYTAAGKYNVQGGLRFTDAI